MLIRKQDEVGNQSDRVRIKKPSSLNAWNRSWIFYKRKKNVENLVTKN